ncbi:hypothetical protein, partial [Streptomyces sp. NPDC056160]|uniref:hypothetical protein n=1 Tax=Streptomyces sp. NPDC056160 TaxID=3345731 RepID=UPI0035DB88B0
MKSKTSARAVARSGQTRVPISSLSRAQKLSAAALMLLCLSSCRSEVGLGDSFGWCGGQSAVDLAG